MDVASNVFLLSSATANIAAASQSLQPSSDRRKSIFIEASSAAEGCEDGEDNRGAAAAGGDTDEDDCTPLDDLVALADELTYMPKSYSGRPSLVSQWADADRLRKMQQLAASQEAAAERHAIETDVRQFTSARSKMLAEFRERRGCCLPPEARTLKELREEQATRRYEADVIAAYQRLSDQEHVKLTGATPDLSGGALNHLLARARAKISNRREPPRGQAGSFPT